ncbi:MAG: hydrogenase expression/formation protein HypE [Epsilonproteobacteria bacterium]|nr:hydrogenase expression/formation protein HypE [Campylobacterota bacterium]
MRKEVTLAMGNGGEESSELIEKLFFKYFKNEILSRGEDGAILDIKKEIATSSDSFTVSPIFFNGGDIGKLSICGSCNDVAMMGAKPKYLTCSFIIEEGLSLRDLEKIVRSMKKELEINGAIVVSGDTKVVPKGAVDKIFINTTAIGEVIKKGISISNLKEGLDIIVSRDIGAHGATIFAAREGIELESNLKSDCASLYPQVEALIKNDIDIRVLRDATRGGVAAVLNEWARGSNLSIKVFEEKVPVSSEVRGICELLGFEPLTLANEGTFVLALPKTQSKKALEVLKEFNENASIIGEVDSLYPKRVYLESSWGTKRFLDMPTGELLPRIC